MTDKQHKYKMLRAIADVIVQRRDELQGEIDSLNMDLQEYVDQLTALEEGFAEIDTLDLELDRLTSNGFNTLAI